jgi:hypothetical protein
MIRLAGRITSFMKPNDIVHEALRVRSDNACHAQSEFFLSIDNTPLYHTTTTSVDKESKSERDEKRTIVRMKIMETDWITNCGTCRAIH